MLSYWWANKIPWSGMDFCRNGKYPDLSEFLVGKALRNHGMLVCPNWLNKKHFQPNLFLGFSGTSVGSMMFFWNKSAICYLP